MMDASSECTNSEMKNNFVLSLRQIASWQIPKSEIELGRAPIEARVPSLQRGAVWEPQQIEILWDSIFRGFPIGSIVVSEKIENQLERKSAQVENDDLRTREITHHILDGQQRCNAIAWGFVNPFQKDMRDDVILWLDLKPGTLRNNTTRKYLFRVTTKAHPWGFGHDDDAKILGVSQRIGLINKLEEKCNALYNQNNFCVELRENIKSKVRPSPKFSFPADAIYPVPLFLLFKHFKGGKLNLNELAQNPWIKWIEFWSEISIKDLKCIEIKEIEDGLKMAEQARLIALSVPSGLESIENVEQIFQRLNRQGTPLDNEELVYSMMKAYWPKIEDIMSKIKNLPITEARLVNLGIRVALTKEGSNKLAPEITVKEIRKIFKSGDHTKDDKSDKSDKNSIEDYFQTNGEIGKALKWIDDYLLYNKDTRTYGLPAYLRSSIAWSSREVFAWLMLLAKRDKYSEPPTINLKKVIGLALSIHWFGLEKEKAIEKLIGETPNITIAHINEGGEKKLVLSPLSVAKLDETFQLNAHSKHEQLVNWTSFWQGVVERDATGEKRPEKSAIEIRDECGIFIEKLRSQNELLVYEQRAEIAEKFDGFDPSNKLMWKGHNRPWDYDHILPSNKLNGQGRGLKKYTEVCQAWQRSIANLVAVDFQFNREAQDKITASAKYPSDEYIKDGAFDITLDGTEHIEVAKKFVLAAKNRLIRTYKEWFEGLEIE
jgi:hypothetical protein